MSPERFISSGIKNIVATSAADAESSVVPLEADESRHAFRLLCAVAAIDVCTMCIGINSDAVSSCWNRFTFSMCFEGTTMKVGFKTIGISYHDVEYRQQCAGGWMTEAVIEGVDDGMYEVRARAAMQAYAGWGHILAIHCC